MLAKKMFPPRELENPLGDDYDEVRLEISFRVQAGQVVMQFSDSIERIRVTGSGARKLAARLTEKADVLDRLGNVPAKAVGNSVTPPKRSSRRAAAKPAE